MQSRVLHLSPNICAALECLYNSACLPDMCLLSDCAYFFRCAAIPVFPCNERKSHTSEVPVSIQACTRVFSLSCVARSCHLSVCIRCSEMAKCSWLSKRQGLPRHNKVIAAATFGLSVAATELLLFLWGLQCASGSLLTFRRCSKHVYACAGQPAPDPSGVTSRTDQLPRMTCICQRSQHSTLTVRYSICR